MQRKSNFEILRIIAMLMIISFHFVVKSGYIINDLNFNTFIIKIFWFFGELGVNLFILITGYFMVKDKMSYKRVILLILETFFYNLINVLLAHHYMHQEIKVLDILFPVILNKYWFVTTYIIVYLFSPYYNVLINNLNRIDFKKLLITCLVLWSTIPTVFGLTINTSEIHLYYSRFIWLSIMYFVGAYIRLYDISFLKRKKNSLIISIVTFILMISSILIIFKFKSFFAKIGTTEYAYFWTPNNVLMLLLSISIFCFFVKLEIKSIKWINILASTTLGIYMLHDGLSNKYLWTEVFYNAEKLTSKYAIFYVAGITLLIFVVGALIDLIRQKLENITVKKVLNFKIFDRLN